MKEQHERPQEEDSDIKANAEKLINIIQQKLPDLKISKQEVASLLGGEAKNRSFDKGQSELQEKGVPSRRSLWQLLRTLGNRLEKMSSTFTKVATILPTVALLFQTFFLGTKTEKLQDQSLNLFQSSELMQSKLSNLGQQTLSFKEDLEKQLSFISEKVNPPTAEEEKRERENRKEMLDLLKKRIRKELSAPANTTNKLSDELKTSIIHFTEYCKPYQVLIANLSSERGYMLDFLLRENIDSSDCIEIFSKGTFQYSDCSRKKFKNVNFSNIDLQYASFEDGAITSSNLREANLSHCNLKGCSFWNSDLEDVELSTADLRNTKFRNARLKNAQLNDSDISGMEFNEGTDFAEIQINGAYSFDFEGVKKMLGRTKLDTSYTLQVEAKQDAKYFEILRIVSK